MLSFTVYTFNDSYPLYLHLNGLQTFFASSAWTSMLFLAVSGITLIGVLTVQQRSLLGYGKAYAGPVLLYALLFLPTAQLRIEDQWSREAYTVDKVPVALAIPLSAVSVIEKNIVDLVDKHITPPNAPSFAQFDFFLEAVALGEILNGKVMHNYETLATIGRYYEDCILKGISTGFVNESSYYRSGQLLIDSYMPWGIYFTEILNPDGTKEVMTCKAAYNRLFGSVSNEAVSVGPASMAQNLSNLFGGRHQSLADTLSSMNSLANAMFPGHQSTSEALFSQAFMINGLQSSLTKSNPQLMAAISQAEVAQATGIASAATIYIKKLPKLRAQIKLIIIGLVPVVGAFFLAQCGRPLFHWALALLAISLWLPIMGLIKASYIASAINELQGMVQSTGGLTLPNKLRLMSWVTDTSTTAGTLAFSIPVITAMLLQILAPRLAMFAGGVAGMARGAEGFSQRSGMQALSGAERTVRELEMDKVNASFLEAGDSHLFRNQRMNELVGSHNNVAFARNTGSSPLQYGGTNTSAVQGQGYTISGGMDARSSETMQQAVASQQGKLASSQAAAAHSLAMGQGTGRSSSDFDRWENSLDKSEQKQLSDIQQAIGGMTESVAKSQGWSAEEKATVDRTLAAGAYAGINFKADRSFAGKILEFTTGMGAEGGGRIEAKAGVTTGESERATQDVRNMLQEVFSSSDISSYAQNRAVSIADSHRTGTGEEWSSNMSRQENFQESMQKVDSAWSGLTATQTAMQQQYSSLSASGGRSVNTGDLLAVTSRTDLEIMAMGTGMQRLQTAFDRGVTNIDDLRIAANADMSSLLRKADAGDVAALPSAMNALDVIANSGQYNAHDARIGMQILSDRSTLAAMADGGSMPSFGAVGSSARATYGANVQGLDAGHAAFSGHAVTRDVSASAPAGGMTASVFPSPHPEAVISGGQQSQSGAGMSTILGAVAPLVSSLFGLPSGGSSGASSPSGGSGESNPQGGSSGSGGGNSPSAGGGFSGLDNPASTRGLGKQLEREADASKSRLRAGAEEKQAAVQEAGREAVDSTSNLDTSRGTFVNTGRVMGGDSSDAMTQVAGAAEQYGFADKEVPTKADRK